jgi:hypothetical protein
LYHPTIAVWNQRQSSNWSGYNQGTIEQGWTLYTSVSGRWVVVPTATQHTPNEQEYSSTWIGIGGGCEDINCDVTDGTLIQEGTEQDVAKNGKASYYAWWELIPAPSLRISAFAVHPGDAIVGTIKQLQPGLWKFVLQNARTGHTWSKTVPYSSTEVTIEWITETPSIIGGAPGSPPCRISARSRSIADWRTARIRSSTPRRRSSWRPVATSWRRRRLPIPTPTASTTAAGGDVLRRPSGS